MLILGSERVITQDYSAHNDAEDYAGDHLSAIKINGRAKVVKVVNKYVAYEDAINYNDYLDNKNIWRDGTYYNCVSITGKTVRYHQSELDGNQMELECYVDGRKRHLRIAHMAEVLVNVGDIIDANTIIGRQGNTGLVLSRKERSDSTYGSHIHFEIMDENYQSINPRDYATGDIDVNYLEQTNIPDSTKRQLKIIADKLNIRANSSITSPDIGDVVNGEIYDAIDISEDDKFIWYNIKTGLGVVGYVANEKGKNLISISNADEFIEGNIKEVDELIKTRLIFTCEKDGMYAIKLKKGEKLYIE